MYCIVLYCSVLLNLLSLKKKQVISKAPMDVRPKRINAFQHNVSLESVFIKVRSTFSILMIALCDYKSILLTRNLQELQ